MVRRSMPVMVLAQTPAFTIASSVACTPWVSSSFCACLRRTRTTERALDTDRHVDKRECRRCNAGDAAGLADGDGADAFKSFAHLAGEAADDAIVDPVGDGDGLGGFEFVDGLALLVEIAGKLDV